MESFKPKPTSLLYCGEVGARARFSITKLLVHNKVIAFFSLIWYTLIVVEGKRNLKPKKIKKSLKKGLTNRTKGDIIKTSKRDRNSLR